MLEKANILVTGGAGTLGRAIARRWRDQNWTGKLTVYSTDEHKHARMRKDFPDVQYIQGDIRNPDTLYNAMCGHDVVIHAAAVKVIPVSEYYSLDTYDVNVNGSLNVFQCAARANVEHVLSISTDKACHSANAYGSTKYMMEKASQEYSRVDGIETQYHLVRYGNVLESTGSVIEAWKNAVDNKQPIKITDLDMTRFWLSPAQAVDLVEDALEFNSGYILIPKMPALSIGRMAEYALGVEFGKENDRDIEVQFMPLRPGEKMHETLLTIEELEYAIIYNSDGDFLLGPTTGLKSSEEMRPKVPYSSDIARELTKEELDDLLKTE